MREDFVVSRKSKLCTHRNTRPKSDIGWACPETAVRPHAGKVKRELPGQKGEEEEVVGEGVCVEGVSVAKNPYLCGALPVPGLESGTWRHPCPARLPVRA